ncbi:MAG TPA: M1 family aminopeptidase [Gemmatimonadales bacterium]|nr:M1 family aminopeptidase [Gemmatimonadales bacterium]
MRQRHAHAARLLAACAAAAAGLALAARGASAQRPTGVVGAYVPPRSWAAPPHGFDLLQQRIAVSFDLARRAVAGTVTTRVVVTGQPTDTIRLNAENLSIDDASAAGHRLRFAADTAHVTVRLPRPAAVGDTVEFTLRYHGTPERGLYFVPRQRVIWTQGEATETRAWVPTYDAPDDKATWDILVTADTGLAVLSNGRLVEVTPAAGGAQRVWHWSQELPASTYLYSVVVGPLTVLHDQWRDVPVDYWVYPDTAEAAWRAFGETPAMIELFSRLLVPFPWAKYDQSAIPDFTYGGMENVSATTQTDEVLHQSAGESPDAGRGLVAHELAHQWFGDLTTTADWADAWINEGMATYMESVQAEMTRGRAAGQLEWIGQQQEAMRADRTVARPLVWGEYQGHDPITLFFSGHIYPKGAQLAHQLRRLLGDSLFWAGLKRFLTDDAYRPVTTADFAVAFEKTCGCDLDWFFDQWAYGIGYPVVHWSRHWAEGLKTLHLIVAQTQPVDSLHPLFRFPVTVRVTTRDSVVRQQITIGRQTDTFAIPLPGPPVSVRFDEGGWLLGQVTSDLTPAELADMAKHDLDFSARFWALTQLAGSQDTAAVAARRFIVLNEHEADLRNVALGQMGHDSTAESRAIVRSALDDPDGWVRAQALFVLSGLDPAAASAVARQVYEGDPDDHVRASALAYLARSGNPEILPLVETAAEPGHSGWLRQTALSSLARFHVPEAAVALERLTVPTETRGLRIAALEHLPLQGDTARAVALATRYLDDPDPLFAASAVETLSRVGGASARVLLLRRYATEQRVRVRSAITEVLHP